MAIIEPCNQCGECCRRGGACALRGKSWSGQEMPLEFDGACSLLEPDGRCGVVNAVIKQDGSDKALRVYMGFTGECTFQELKIRK